MEVITFSKLLKEELSHIELNDAEKLVQLKTVIQSNGKINFNSFTTQLEIAVPNPTIAKQIIKTLKTSYSNNILQIAVQRTRKFSHNVTTYIITIMNNVKELLYELGLIDNKEANMIFSLNSFLLTLNENLQNVYIRTYWILNGTVNDPRKQSQYHLEFVDSSDVRLKDIQKVLKRVDINFKLSKRKNNYPLYLNKSEEIADFLKYIGAVRMLFDYEDYRITRDFRNANNRINNAEIANEMKKQKTAENQIKAIQKLYTHNLLDTLTTKARQVAKLRLENPDDTLSELSEKTGNEISKSNISYHLKKIITLAKEIEDEN